ncbi:MFS transporter [Gryllotalpicola protaetiae]|uniref:MFS transporter n=1 Tax=Gryllotalpicola protaetiae TaxID=2419771 RepID=A0A387C1E0_9MICO|nr:MFS transporter [Gryllotalpicola protaetiae]AYG04331.1 MFS transporter [Gryllotalpicola protaetiae]
MPRTAAGSAVLSPARIRFALIALALGGFAIGSTEFVAMGLLPDIAHAMLPQLWAANHEDANARAGWMVSAYALGVVVGAPTIAASAAKLPRKKLLLWLLVAFTVATVAAALSPNFGSLLVFRFLCGLPHGAYFGIASLVAGDLMGEGKRVRAVAFVMTGLTVANIVGVPAITWVGETYGWRVAYLFVAGLFALTFVAIAAAVPWQPGNPEQTFRRELSAFRHPQLWFALGMGAIGFGGFFALYTYIAPLVTDVAHLPQQPWVPLVLVVCGLGMFVGNLAGGRAGDYSVKLTIFASFGAVMVSLAFTGLFARIPVLLIIGVFLVGAAASAVAPAVQSRLMDVAHDAHSIAAALNHSAFNIGNSLGAYLGGVVISFGFGYRAPVWIGLVLTLLGLVIASASFLVERRTGRLRAHTRPLELSLPAVR